MKSKRILLSLVLLISAAILPCLAQKTGAQDRGIDLTIHKFQPKGRVGEPAGAVQGPAMATASKPAISASASAQISALRKDKVNRTPVQRKIDSQLIYTARMMRNQPVVSGLQYIGTDVNLDQNNHFVVDITAEVTPALLKQMTAAGSKIIYSNARYRSIRATVSPDQLETVASLPGVVHVSRMQEATTNRIQRTGNENLRHAATVARNERLSSFLKNAATARRSYVGLGAIGSGTVSYGSGQGSQVSEGDSTHGAVDTRTQFGVDGAGLKIGVLSDGVTSLAESQTLGDLGPVTVLPGQTGSGDEGTAMLEIVHDLAPGAQLYFATAFNGVASFAQNIRDLRAAGCDIIVDDVFYYVESPFQDGQAPSIVSSTNGGLITQAVNDVTADGALYFSSAGNSGGLSWGTSGTWEGDFVNGGTLSLISDLNPIHQFAPGSLFDAIVVAGGPITLYWSDPLGGPASDYDLYVIDPTGSTVLAASADDQSIAGTDPFEAVGSTQNVAGNLILVAKFAGEDRFLHLDTNRGALDIATAGQTHGHNSAAEGFGVAATPALEPFYAGLPMGPYPNFFTAADLTEAFSSDGPRRLFFQPDGTPYTPANFSSTGGIVRQKPDFTAADGVSVTGVGGFGSPFYGTSAAAPHAAAIAALVKSARPTITSAEVRTTLTNTAIDILDPGVDLDSGAGILNALESVRSLGVAGVANPDIQSVAATDNPGNGDGIIEAGEGGKLVIQLRNTGGVVDATNINATLTTSTPGVIVTRPNTSTFANMPASTGTATNDVPFTFTLASDYPCGQDIDFTLTVNYTGGPSATRDLKFRVSTEQPPVDITEVLDLTAPNVSLPLIGTTGVQTGRMYRGGTASTCGTTATWPGFTSNTGARRFDSYTFTACRSTCAQVTTMTPGTAAQQVSLFAAMYSPQFNSADISSGYVGDAGSSGGTTQFGVSTVAGSPYTVVVHEVNPGGATGQNYNVKISSCAVNCRTPNRLPIALAQDVTATITNTTYLVAASIDNGSNDPDGDPITITQTPAGPYPLGTTPVILTVTDSKGAAAQASATLTVQDVPVSFAVTSPLAYTTGVSQSNTVGSITHPVGVAGDLTATISWGDGTADTTGAVGGTAPSFTVTGTHTYAAAGTFTLTVSIQDIHGGTATQSASVVISNPDFAFTTTVPTVTVLQGQSVQRTITITPNPAPFNAAIALTCTSDIERGGCTITPSSVTPGSSPTNVTMTITTSGPYGTRASSRRIMPTYAALFGGLGLMGLAVLGRQRSGKWMRMAVIAVLLGIAVIGLVNCGGHRDPATTLGTYNIRVTATSGSVTHSTTTTLTVNQL